MKHLVALGRILRHERNPRHNRIRAGYPSRLIIPLFIKKDEDLMKRLTRIASISMASMLAAASLVACSGSTDEEGDVYFLNFKPEQDAAYQEIAKAYTEETGVKVKVVTAASGSYEQTLKAEIGKDEAPTLFQVNGPAGFITWQDYIASYISFF